MPNPSIDGVDYQVRIKWLLHGQQCINVLNFTSRGVVDLITDVLEPILACVTDNLLPVLSDDITLQGADIKSITGSVLQEAESTLVSANVGGDSADSLPSINAAVVALRTTHPGRTGRGRMFLPGIPEDHQSASSVDATFIAAAVAFLACMAAAYVNSDPLATPFFHWAVRSRKDNQNYPITSTAVRSVVGSMRSRKIG
jgi:hypothetical protein